MAFAEATSSYRIALVALVAGVEVLAPGYEFGQRENILLIAVFPYLFAAAAVASGFSLPRALSLGIGVLAGVGFALKPYFLILWLAIEFLVVVSLACQQSPSRKCRDRRSFGGLHDSGVCVLSGVFRNDRVSFGGLLRLWSVRKPLRF